MSIIRDGIEYSQAYLSGVDLFNVYLGGVTYVRSVPAAPDSLRVVGVGSNYIDWTWTAPDDGGSTILGYDYQRSVISENGPWFERPEPEIRVIRVGDPAEGRYYHRIRAYNAVGAGPWSPVATYIV